MSDDRYAVSVMNIAKKMVELGHRAKGDNYRGGVSQAMVDMMLKEEMFLVPATGVSASARGLES